MQNFIYVIISCLIPLSVNGILSLVYRQQNEEKNIVTVSKIFGIVGTIGSIILLLGTFFSYRDGERVIPLFLLFSSLICLSLQLFYYNHRISYDDDGFTYQNFLGIRHYFNYTEITGQRKDGDGLVLICGKHKVHIIEDSNGAEEFYDLVKKKYRLSSNGKALPWLSPYKKHDVFNGNIVNGTAMFSAILICTLLAFIFSIYLFFDAHAFKKTPLLQKTIRIEYAEKEDSDTVNLYTFQDTIPYRISYAGKLLPDDFVSACQRGDIFTVSYFPSGTEKAPFYDVNAMSAADGTVHFTVEEMEKEYFHNYIFASVLMLCFGLLLSGMLTGMVMVGRHPEKYSRKVQNIFFRPDAWQKGVRKWKKK